MSNPSNPIVILVADDDEDDRLLTEDALSRSRLANDLRFVRDGEELMDYLKHRGRYESGDSAPRPGLILLDLNMPKKDGREALAEIKSDQELRSIPVVILTASRADEGMFRTYDLGVNAFITKPVEMKSLIEVIRKVSKYWFEIVESPRGALHG